MKYTRKLTANLLIILVILSSVSVVITTSIKVTAGSSSSGDVPPPSGGNGDTSGGGAAGGMYFNYRIPLIFKEGEFGPSIVTITVVQNGTALFFNFISPKYGNQTTLFSGEPLVLNPKNEPELTNGSLIQSTGPLQINVYHSSKSELYDDSYSYSVLVMSMWGRLYQSPFDNIKAKIMAGFNNTEIQINHPDSDIQEENLDTIGDSLDVTLFKGSIIEANGPIGVVLYNMSTTTGTFAFTSIPKYLWGTEYSLSSIPESQNIVGLTDNSAYAISTINEMGTIFFTDIYEEINTQTIAINETISLSASLDDNYYEKAISTSANYSITLCYDYEINDTRHKSAFQFISPDNMKWAELYYTSVDQSHNLLRSIFVSDNTTVIPFALYDNGTQIAFGDPVSGDIGTFITFGADIPFGLYAEGYLFSYIFSEAPERFNWNSTAHLLYPLNLYSYIDNTSTSFPSWYRFPDLNVRRMEIYPENPTELRNLKLDIIIQNNGTIPCAPFYTTVFINDTLRIHKKIDGLDINETFSIPYEQFQGFGIKTWNVSVYVDSRNQIFELAEFNNSYEMMVVISRNWNIIYIGIAVLVISLSISVFVIIKKAIKKRRESKNRYDMIFSEVEV